MTCESAPGLEWSSFQGRAAIATLLATRIFTPGRHWRLLPTRANGSPAFGLYRREVGASAFRLFGLMVLGVEGEQIASLGSFALSLTNKERGRVAQFSEE